MGEVNPLEKNPEKVLNMFIQCNFLPSHYHDQCQMLTWTQSATEI